jgi:long-chain fatty acid transport protein
MTWAAAASASSGIDSPESGVVQSGRGSAWLARADDPLAAYFNPAAMAFQSTGVHLGAQLMFMNRCYSRLGEDGKPVSAAPGVLAPLLPGEKPPPDSGAPPANEQCTGAKPFPNPQIAATFRVTNNLAIGVAIVAPHASGSNSWPEQLDYTNAFNFPSTQPSPQRYLLVSSNALILFPTVSVAYAPTDYLSFGAGFTWGIGTVDFTNFSQATSPKPAAGMTGDMASNDVKAQLKAKDLFIPGFVLSALWMPASRFDVAAWFKWSDALKADADLRLEALYWKPSGQRNATACADMMNSNPSCNVTTVAAAGTVKFQVPMEAKIGFRYHHPRQDPQLPGWASTPGRKVRDPMSEDLFDIEVNFTWANNSANQDLQLGFKPGIKINDGSMAGVGELPSNANIPHQWKDVVGVRLGGDFVAVPNRLAIRAGGFYEIKGQDDKYLNIDFNLAQKAGVSGGATVRVGPVDISVVYQHTFFGTIANGGKGAVYALSGDGSGCKDPKNPSFGQGCFRSWQSVNGGTLTANLNEVGLAGTMHF